jgi:hypothetical protein
MKKNAYECQLIGKGRHIEPINETKRKVLKIL